MRYSPISLSPAFTQFGSALWLDPDEVRLGTRRLQAHPKAIATHGSMATIPQSQSR